MVQKSLEEARIRMYLKHDYTRPILFASVIAAVILIFIGLLNLLSFANITDFYTPITADEHPIRTFLNFIVFALLALFGPYGFYMAKKQRDIRAIEVRLPEFLRDVAEAGRFGMTLADAIVVASSGRYGKLTPEIKKMASQISWGVPATEALRLFSERVKTPAVGRVCSIIIKSSDAGGDVADVLTMVAHDTKEAQLTEDERRITMSTYIAVIYISFLVFLVTVWILNVTFLPKMVEASTSLLGDEEDSALLQQGGILPQDLPGIVFNIRTAFFIAAIVHAVGDGILAGVLENGRVTNGLRHSFIMLLIGFILLLLI